MSTLAELFSNEPYSFKMRFQRGGIHEFFRPTADHAALLAERRRWLESDASTCAALLPESVPLLAETIALAEAERTLSPPALARLSRGGPAWERCLALGEAWEPDFLLLRLDAEGQFRLWGGCVCFPSSWSLAEKIGQPLDFIHGVVPGLNPALGSQIQGFLDKIKPGLAWRRANWELSRSPELNQHPARKLPRLDASADLRGVWLRVEDQALVALPNSGGILFGIRIAIYPLAEVKRDPAAAQGLSQALETMPEDVARYKNVAGARATLLRLLDRA